MYSVSFSLGIPDPDRWLIPLVGAVLNRPGSCFVWLRLEKCHTPVSGEPIQDGRPLFPGNRQQSGFWDRRAMSGWGRGGGIFGWPPSIQLQTPRNHCTMPMAPTTTQSPTPTIPFPCFGSCQFQVQMHPLCSPIKYLLKILAKTNTWNMTEFSWPGVDSHETSAL